MKRKLFLLILIIFFTTSFISIGECNNQTTTKQSSVSEEKIKENYGLQERCGNKSEEYFKKEHGNGVYEDEIFTRLSNYYNHYNKKMNKCFVIESQDSFTKNSKYKNGKFKVIIDVNENKIYGVFLKNGTEIMKCSVSGKECYLEEEWDSLVKPYMEE